MGAWMNTRTATSCRRADASRLAPPPRRPRRRRARHGGVEARIRGRRLGRSSGPAAVASGLSPACSRPRQTEGPYYLEGDKVRRNVREGQAGRRARPPHDRPRRLELQADPGAAVDIWHCDAGGTYSGFAQEGTEGARSCAASSAPTEPGSRSSRRSTLAGTRAGRCTSTCRCTSVATSSTPASSTSPTRSRTSSIAARRTTGARVATVRNASDSIFRNGGSRSMLKLARNGNRYIGRITMGVQTS